MKLVAWNERRRARPNRDAADIAYFLRHAEALISTEHLFTQHLAAVELCDYDLPLAACFVLGGRVRLLASAPTRELVQAILAPLQKEGVDAALVRDVATSLPGIEPERIFELLQQLNAGFEKELQ